MKNNIIAVILLLCTSANAGIFGPSNFEECILEQMKGIKSDAAANAVTYACRAKFPAKETPKSEQKRYGYLWELMCILSPLLLGFQIRAMYERFEVVVNNEI